MDKEVTMKFPGIRTACVILTLCLVLFCGSMPASAQNADAGSAPAAKTANAAKISLNTATAEQLTSLPGIGPATAKLIIEHREKAGKFNRIEELMNVRGIGEKKFESLKDRLTL